MNRFLFSAKPTLIELCLGSGFFLFYFVHCTIRTIFYIYCLINNTARTKIIQLNKYFRIRILVRNSGNLIIANFHFKCTNHIIGSCSLYTKIQVIVLYVISHRITSSLKIYYWKSQLSNCVISANIKAQYKMRRGSISSEMECETDSDLDNSFIVYDIAFNQVLNALNKIFFSFVCFSVLIFVYFQNIKVFN